MASTYSTNLKIQLMTTGENNTTWGTVTNTNLGTAVEEAIAGSADVTFSSGNESLTLSNSNGTQVARHMRLNLTGTTGGSTRVLTVPDVEKVYIVNNGCADAIEVKNSTGSNVSVPAGTSTWVYSTGSNVVDAVTSLTSLAVGGSNVVTLSATQTLTNKTLTAAELGSSTATTQSSGDNSTKVATTAYVDAATGTLGTMSTQDADSVDITGGTIAGAALAAAYPVGSIYMNATSSTNPATLLGFGTWTAFGAGKMLVGLDAGDTDFDTAEETGGSKDSDLQAHTHLIMGYSGGGLPSGTSPGGYTTNITNANRLDAVAALNDADTSYALKSTTGAADRGLTSESGSGDGTGANLPPYIVVYMWKRTA